ncbi:MAG: hypothetical protein FWF50_02320 [Defluviitaleaceae bacterium]|nr:hypothetical protein [Defluviitaleaceae bacterium]
MATKADLVERAAAIEAWIVLAEAGLHEELLKLMKETAESFKKAGE